MPLFSKPKLGPPRHEVEVEVGHWMGEFFAHYEKSYEYFAEATAEDPPNPFDSTASIKHQRILLHQSVALGKALLEAKSARECLERARTLWTEGDAAISHYIRGLDEWIHLINNSQELNDINLRDPMLNTSMSRMRYLLASNRKCSEKADDHFKKAANLINSISE